ncbi:hypothetical protein D3C86_1590750 [compost metagenome]
MLGAGFYLAGGQLGDVRLSVRDQCLNLAIELGQAFGLLVRLGERSLQLGEILWTANGEQLAKAFELLFGRLAQGLELQLAELLNAGEDFAADLLDQVKVGFLSGLQFFRVEKRHA